jgi:hypothetical protein
MDQHPTDQTQKRTAHGCPAGSDHDREVPEVDLLSPLTIRGVTLRNRIVMSPMSSASPGMGSPTTGTWSTWAAGRPAGWRW